MKRQQKVATRTPSIRKEMRCSKSPYLETLSHCDTVTFSLFPKMFASIESEQMSPKSPEWRQKVPKKSRTNPGSVRFPSRCSDPETFLSASTFATLSRSPPKPFRGH
jgi:hypothetical protein